MTEPTQIFERRQSDRLVDLHETLILDHEIVATPAPSPAVPRIAKLLDIDEHQLDRESPMGKNSGEKNELVKHVEHPAAFGAAASFDRLAATLGGWFRDWAAAGIFCGIIQAGARRRKR